MGSSPAGRTNFGIIMLMEMNQTLVLDASCFPVARVSWQRAVTLFFQEKVEIIEEYEDRELRSVTFSMKMPSIVRFVKAVRRRKKVVKFSRSNVYDRDGGKCQYCKTKVHLHSYTYDHVVPKSRGGKTVWDNIVVSCIACNQKKGCRTLDQAGMKLVSKPVRPKKLSGRHLRFNILWRVGMPETWKSFLASVHYWNDELEE